MTVYKCKECGAMHENLRQGAVPVCCGEPMTALEPGTVNEKHVPVVTREGDIVTARVGAVEHPMNEEHFIEWIAVETATSVYRTYLKPGQAPEAKFVVPADEKITVYEFCNLHGLWKAEA